MRVSIPLLAGAACGVAIVLGSAVIADARSRSGETITIEADCSGISGSVGSSSPDGFSLCSTLGLGYGGSRLASAGGFEIHHGLWGGSMMQACGSLNMFCFGDPNHPALLQISPGTLDTDYVIYASTSPLTQPLNVAPPVLAEATANLQKNQSRFTRPLNDQIWEIVVLDAEGRHVQPGARGAAVLTLPFNDEDADGIVDGTAPPVRVGSLSVWWLDEAHSLWVKLPGSAVDPSLRRVSVPIRHFSVYAVMGAPTFQVGDVYAFPVPWRPQGPQSGIGPGQTGTLSDGITFTNMPEQAVVRVYTMSGNLVREILHSDGRPQLKWDVKNSSGEDVSSGTYIYVVESSQNRKTGQLVIIR